MKKIINDIQKITHEFSLKSISMGESIILPTNISIFKNDKNEISVNDIQIYFNKFTIEDEQIKLLYTRTIDNNFANLLKKEILDYIKNVNLKKSISVPIYKINKRIILRAFDKVVEAKCNHLDDYTCKSIFVAVSDYILSLYFMYVAKLNYLKIQSDELTTIEHKLTLDFMSSVLNSIIFVYTPERYKTLLLNKFSSFDNDEKEEIFENQKQILLYKCKYEPTTNAYSLLTTCIENHLFVHAKYNSTYELFSYYNIDENIYVSNIN